MFVSSSPRVKWCLRREAPAADPLKRPGMNLPEPAMPPLSPSRSRTSRPSLAPSSLRLWGTDQEDLLGAGALRDLQIQGELANLPGKSLPSGPEVGVKGMSRGSGDNHPRSVRENTVWKLLCRSQHVRRGRIHDSYEDAVVTRFRPPDFDLYKHASAIRSSSSTVDACSG